MIIRKETLLAVLPATTKEDKRYFMDAVRLTPAQALATNGHVLLIAKEETPQKDEDFPIVPGADFHGDPDQPVVIPTDIIRSMIATMPKSATLPILDTIRVGANGAPGSMLVAATDLQAPRVAVVDMTDIVFPQFERVLLAEDRPEIGAYIAVDVLETLIKSAKAICGSGRRGRKAVIRFGFPLDANERAGVPTDAVDASGETIMAPGDVTGRIRIDIAGHDGLSVSGVAMPCRG